MVSARRLARIPVPEPVLVVPASMERFEPDRWIDWEEVPPMYVRPEELEMWRYMLAWRRWRAARKAWRAEQGGA